MPSVNARKVFEIRLGMLDIIFNFKEKYKNNIACRQYKKEGETFQHFFKCKKYSDKIQLKDDFNPDVIYGSDVVIIKDIVKILGQIEKLRDELLQKISLKRTDFKVTKNLGAYGKPLSQ